MRVIRAEQLLRSGEPTEALEERCIHSARCDIAGVVLELRTDNAEVARLFAQRYADHQTESAAHFRYYAATVPGGYAFWCGHAASWRWSQGSLPADAVLFLIDTVAMSALVRFDKRIATMQAAAVEYGGVAAAIASHSTRGKTTTLFACARRGMRLYSDERTVMRDATVYPFLRRCSIRGAGARLLLSEGEGNLLCDAHQAPQLSIRTCFGAKAVATPRKLRALFVLSGTGHCAALEAIDTATALSSIVRWFDSRGDMTDRIARAIGALKDVKCYRLTLGTPDETAAAMSYALTRIAAAAS